MILSFFILFSFLFLGDVIRLVLDLSIPGSVIGLLLLTAALYLKVIKEEWIKPAAKLLLDHMAFLFVPAGVALLTKWQLIADNFIAIISIIILSTLLTLAATGLVQQFLESRGDQ